MLELIDLLDPDYLLVFDEPHTEDSAQNLLHYMEDRFPSRALVAKLVNLDLFDIRSIDTLYSAKADSLSFK